MRLKAHYETQICWLAAEPRESKGMSPWETCWCLGKDSCDWDGICNCVDLWFVCAVNVQVQWEYSWCADSIHTCGSDDLGSAL
jgi:hypothetical protein